MSQWPWPWRQNEERSGTGEPLPLNITTPLPERPAHSKKSFPSGIKSLYNSGNCVVDIVFVHGLTGDREETWKVDGASDPWLTTLLPSKVVNARILTFGYDAYVSDWRGMVSKNRIGNHSMNLLAAIATHREDDDTNDRPLIFVCHSLGGLVCQDALAMAKQRPEKHLKQILHCTRGILFLGTPHNGSGLAHWAQILAKTLGLIKQMNPEILAVLKSESEVLERVQASFHTMILSRARDGLPEIEITCFYEELPLPGVGMVVESHSAILPGYIPIGIRKNHMEMTRFEDMNDPGFISVAGELRRWSKDLASTTQPPSEISHPASPLGPESITETPSQRPHMDNQSGTPSQELTGGVYRDIQYTNLPDEIAQHLPQANMGPKERKVLKAAGKGDVDEINRLVKEGANLSAINQNGESALTKAISKRHISVVRLLLDNGATTDYEGFLVEKPLHIAVQTGDVKVVELLLDNGADIDEQTAEGTVLSKAIKTGREEITSFLLSRDADVNLAKYSLYAPLMNAIVEKNPHLIKSLLKRGAETNVLTDQYGQSMTQCLPESSRSFLRDWRAGRYEDQVQIIRDPSSDKADKEKALSTALARASKEGQAEIHSMFIELAEELNIAGTKEYV